MTAMGRSAVAVAKWALSTIVSVHFSVRYSEVRPCASLAAQPEDGARARARNRMLHWACMFAESGARGSGVKLLVKASVPRKMSHRPHFRGWQ